jgi:hypothetical protein
MGYIQPNKSPWETFVLFKNKKDYTLKMCVHYC